MIDTKKPKHLGRRDFLYNMPQYK